MFVVVPSGKSPGALSDKGVRNVYVLKHLGGMHLPIHRFDFNMITFKDQFYRGGYNPVCVLRARLINLMFAIFER
jgi:hypothetical protein